MIDKFCPRGQQRVTSANNSNSRVKRRGFLFCFSSKRSNIVRLEIWTTSGEKKKADMQHTVFIFENGMTYNYNIQTTLKLFTFWCSFPMLVLICYTY